MIYNYKLLNWNAVTRPKTKQSQSYLFWLPWTSTGLGQGCCWKINPGKSTAVRRSCVPPPFYRHLLITNYYTYTHINTYICIHLPTPDPSPPSLRTASLTSGSGPALILAAGPDGWLPELDYFPCCKVVCLCIMCFCCWGVFLFSHCTPQGA